MDSPAEAFVVSILCSSCDAMITLGDARCSGCQRVLTPLEKDTLRRRWEASDPDAARSSDTVAYGRLGLVVVAGLSLIDGMISLVLSQATAALILSVIITLVMLVLFWAAGRRPLTALFSGLAVYLLLQLLAALVAPWTLVQGILIKFLVIAALTGGIGAELYLRRRLRTIARRRAP
jgi:hypothetical protein